VTRYLLAAALAAGAFAIAAPAQACEYQVGRVCVPSTCVTAASVVSTVNHAAGDPLPYGFPHCID
jgi:hypothetical protein